MKGLIRKQFMWGENGIAGGVYQWESLADAKAFYQGPWLDGILARYGVYPEIEYFVTFAVTENPGGERDLHRAAGARGRQDRGGVRRIGTDERAPATARSRWPGATGSASRRCCS